MSDARSPIRSAADLLAAGLISGDRVDDIARVGARYAIALTPQVADLIDRDDRNDPIGRQFIPDVRELATHAAERADPIGDHLKSPAPGIVHRYADRVLWKIASVCPVYCRFCFRREMVGPDLGEAPSREDMAAAIAYIAANPRIWEVILTGGDPFVLSARRIRDVTAALGDIPHVKILRWHTRVPVVEPDRVCDELVAALKTSTKTVYVGLHTNHPRELTANAIAAIARLVDAGIPVISQTVLLKGVNDDADTLEQLLRALVAARVKPYYLHHGDLAPGTAHLRTTIAEGQALVSELRRRVSGLAMPSYVLDIPGAFGKVPVHQAHITTQNDQMIVHDPSGGAHLYADACAVPDVPEPDVP